MRKKKQELYRVWKKFCSLEDGHTIFSRGGIPWSDTDRPIFQITKNFKNDKPRYPANGDDGGYLSMTNLIVDEKLILRKFYRNPIALKNSFTKPVRDALLEGIEKTTFGASAYVSKQMLRRAIEIINNFVEEE